MSKNKINKPKSKSRALYVTLDILTSVLSLIALSILVISVLMTFGLVGLAVEGYFHIAIYNWMALGLGVLAIVLFLCITAKEYLQRFKNVITYSVIYMDVNEEQIEVKKFNDYTTAVEVAENDRDRNDIVFILVVKHSENEYTNKKTSYTLITYENVNSMKEIKKTISEDKMMNKNEEAGDEES